jgi:NADPH:quinone reductase-like Zn-dependent oxidoreductase/ubiquinone/menaquinone biosynthesis C-methylase UbiE
VGGIDLESACKISFYRGQFAAKICESAQAGSMLAVGLSELDVLPYLETSQTSLACINSPSNVTIAGAQTEIQALHARLEAAGIFSKELKTGVAYHSPIMSSVADEYAESITSLTRPEGPYVITSIASTVTGELVSDLAVFTDAQYWVRNLVSPVKFSQALLCLTARPKGARKLGKKAQVELHDIVEIGPSAALKRPIMETLTRSKQQLRYWSSLSRSDSPVSHMLGLVGQMFCLGYKVDLASVNRIDPSKRHRTLTDLPQYSFSHLRSYWHEGTLSAQTRRRHHFPRPLLGAPVADWNPLEPKWRQYLSVQALPWLADHRVDGAILLPGAAMIVLVLEAALQMAPSDATIKGYHIKEASFSSPIIIPDEEDEYAEVETHYRPLWSPLANGSTWSEVRIYVRSRGSEAIQESCRAVVQVEFEHLKTGLDTGAEKLVHTSLLKERYHELASRCEKAVDPKSVYRTYNKMGLQYGPFFRGLMQPTWNGVDTCKANIMLSDMEGSVDDSSDFLIHPATLDILAHLMWVPLTNGGTCAVPTALPTRIRDAWISNTGLRNNRVHSMRGVARSFKRDFRVIEGTAVLLNDADEPVLSLGSLEFTTISRPGPNSKETRFQPLCFSVRTRPDIDLIDKKSMAQLIQPIQTHCHSEAMFNLDLHQALRWFIDSALCQLQCDTENLQPHMQRYVEWMRLQCKRYPDLDSALMDDVAEREKLLVRIEVANDRGKVFVAFGRQLLSIISGEVDPLEVLFSSGLAEGFYADLVQSVSAGKKLWRYLDALAFKNPSLKILEVGAGTGSMTPFVVAPLLSGANTSDAFPRISKYDFTDVSAGFFEKAKEKLAPTVPLDRFDFKVFDLESDPETQTLEASSYDLIVAASVIHATKDLKSTLARLRLLLKPAGKLILFEVVQPECIRAAFIFGTLPGWWLSTDSKDNYREAGPNITGDQWREVLAETGFSVDAMVRDHEEDLCHEFGFIFASAVEEAKSVNVTRGETTLIVSPNRDMRNDLCSALRSSLETMGWPKCRTLSLDEVRTPHDLTGHRIVVIAEMEDPVLCNLSESHYNAVNLIASSGKGILWVTRTGEGTDQYADFQMINGLARVCRTENPNRAFVTLALQDRKAVQSSAATLSKVLQKLDETGWSTEHSEMEYIERDDMLHIRRLMEEEDMDQSIQSKIMPRLREELFGSASPLALTVHSPGLLDSLCFVADTEAGSDLQLQPEEILVDVRAIGLNFRDVLIALGALDSDRLGVECTGVVRQAGRQATVQPGDRVIVANMGCARALVKCNSQVVVKIPEDMTFEEAASFPTAGVTAYYSLIEMGRIQQGETILIHAGAGGTGQMCIQLAQMVGCEVYTTTSSQSKKDFLMSTYGIPSDHIFYSRNASFAQAITQATNGRGVDVLVNSLAGDSLVASWELMAPHGRFIELGRADIKGNSNLPMMTFEKNVSFIAVAIDYICDHRPALLAKMLRAVTEMLVRGDLKLPSPRRNYSVSEVTDAFRYLQSGASVGKIVLTMEPSDVVQVGHFPIPPGAA